MKTTRTIATIALAAFLVLGPTLAFGATRSMTLTTNSPNYSGQQTITVTGTVSPAPTVGSTAVVVTTKGPSGAVDIGEAVVATGSGAFTYVLVSGGSANWVTGTYTVNGTWGGQGDTASAITTFTYAAVQGGGGQTVTVTSTTTTTVVSTTTVTTTTAAATTTIVNPDTQQLQTLSVNIAAIQNAVQGLSSTLSSLQSAVNTANTGVTNLGTTIQGISSGLSTLGNVGNQISSMNSAVNNNQTYVLVVAALAAITLVLELAILVRKLS